MIPFVGSAFSRSSFGFMQGDGKIDVPVARFAEAFLRTVILVAVLIGGYLVVQPFLQTGEVQIADEQIVEAFGWDEERFADFLKDCDRQQLTDVMQNWVVDPNIPYDSRKRVLLNQIRAAKKISSSRMNQQKNYGVSKEILLRSELAMLGLRNGVFDQELNQELLSLSSLYKSVQLEQVEEAKYINEKAKLGEIIAETVELVEVEDFEEDLGEIDDLLDRVKQLSEHFLSNSDTGRTLSKLTGLAEQRLIQLDKPTKLTDRFDQLLNSIHIENKTLRIKDLADLNCLEASASELVYLPDSDARFQDKFLVEFSDKLNEVLEVQDIAAQDYSMILTKLSELAESGWPRQASQMLTKVVDSFHQNGSLPDLEEQARKLRARLDWVGQSFDTQVVNTLDNRPPAFRNSDALATIVIYISMKTQRASDTRFKQLGRVYNSVFRNARIDFVVVFVHENDQRNGLQAMRVLEDRMKPVDFWQLNANSPGGIEFSKNLSIDETPYVVILDKSRRTVALNPRSKMVVEILTKLQSQQ